MGIGSGIALAAGLGAAGSIGGAAIGAHAAGSAADAQVNAANHAADIQHQDAQSALDFQKQQWGTSQANAAPWLQAGRGGLANLSYLMGIPGYGGPQGGGQGNPGGQVMNPDGTMTTANAGMSDPYGQSWSPDGSQAGGQMNMSSLINPSLGGYGSLAQGWTGGQFQAPTAATEQNDPGYQFRLKQGQDALENSASASGTTFSGATGAALQQYGQDYASNEYGNVYNRALGQYQQNYNQFQQGQADKYNRLAALSGTGQITAQQLGQQGQQAAGNVGNILMQSGQQIGQDYNNAGAARASGYVGAGNAIAGGLQGAGNTLSQYMMLKNLLPPGSIDSGGGYGGPATIPGYS